MDKRFMLMALVLGFTALSAQEGSGDADTDNKTEVEASGDVACNDAEVAE